MGEAWLYSYREILESWKPDVVISYGGFGITPTVMKMAKELGAKTIFYLCNYFYNKKATFEDVDTVVCLSKFHANWCKETLGIDAVPVYPLMPKERYLCEPDLSRRFVTLVNPQPHKGVYVFAKIVEVMSRLRPDIPFLVVESRAASDWLAETGADLSRANLHRMANTPDPRDYLKVTKLMLVPSVWQESFGRVAAEAMMNGIPVIGSDRGSLPEVIGDQCHLVGLSDWMTSETKQLPTDEEVKPWVERIIELWDGNEKIVLPERFASVEEEFERVLLN